MADRANVDKKAASRAWNDPPELNKRKGSESSKRLQSMRKRIPVPTDILNSNPFDRPKDVNVPLKKPPQDTELKVEVESKEMGGSADILEVENLFFFLFEMFSLRKGSAEAFKEDIINKFHVLKTLWLSGQIPTAIQNLVIDVLKAAQKNDFDFAKTLLKKLLSDYDHDCSEWAPAIEVLISESEIRENNLLTLH